MLEICVSVSSKLDVSINFLITAKKVVQFNLLNCVTWVKPFRVSFHELLSSFFGVPPDRTCVTESG